MQNVNAIRLMPDRAFRVAVAAGVALLLAACAPAPRPFPELPSLTVSTYIGSANMCGLGVSPAIRIGNAPESTARYKVRMSNTSVLFQTPWEATFPARPDGIPEAAAENYDPPCPGQFQGFNYHIEVLALDAADRPVAYGSTNIGLGSIDKVVTAEHNQRTAGTPLQPPTPPANTVTFGSPVTYNRNPGSNPFLVTPPAPAP
ncbi:MAG TPA: hypothetical protein VF342_12920 [Alphaproteobacteria bacterium]